MKWLDAEDKGERSQIEAGMVGVVVKAKADPNGRIELIYADGKVVQLQATGYEADGIRVRLITA